jgi:response regulator RpfG family c-di-GMP phosphodiesterase
MAVTNTVLCTHRDPDELRLLRDKGYELTTATNGSDGLRLLFSRPVDAVLLEYSVRPFGGAEVVDEIRRVRPHVPIVIVADPQELSRKVLKSVDTLVAKSDRAYFRWAAVHFLLTTTPDLGSVRC